MFQDIHWTDLYESDGYISPNSPREYNYRSPNTSSVDKKIDTCEFTGYLSYKEERTSYMTWGDYKNKFEELDLQKKTSNY